ncbi:hypothetical protein P3342_003532 [Pyrenophora teres f. teres]|nr:hypothetical protein P3342_003532 [Pyrenophora teres f. teres]
MVNPNLKATVLVLRSNGILHPSHATQDVPMGFSNRLTRLNVNIRPFSVSIDLPPGKPSSTAMFTPHGGDTGSTCSCSTSTASAFATRTLLVGPLVQDAAHMLKSTVQMTPTLP